MNPFEATTNTVYRSKGLWKNWASETPTKRRPIALSTKSGEKVKGYTSTWKIVDPEAGDEFGVVMACIPEKGFASVTRTATSTVFSHREIYFLTLLALTAKMGDHGVDIRMPRSWEGRD